mmetsp:Transcript_30074/g.84731  ORF Transcript_30074/g.84731 Transcript_30074/m.84731 type:complete len:830 (-) Transcript_30074:245-2734(-)
MSPDLGPACVGAEAEEAEEECATPSREVRKPDSCPSSPRAAQSPIMVPHDVERTIGRAQSQPLIPAFQGTCSSDHASANVRVVCRLRPLSDRERKAGTVPAVTSATEQREVAVVRKVGGTRQMRSTFHFDEVLSSFSTQREVFAATLQPLVQQVLQGYEATAFAYGQTGTGKTYTMEGCTDSEDKRGLIPRAAAAVLDALKSRCYVKHRVTMSYLEIYNEELSDLLAPPQSQARLEIMDRGENRGVCCVGLSEVPVSSLGDILGLVHTAQERKRVAETRVNSRSSRSHCIFTLKVHCCRAVDGGGELENVGKLHLVDLAGSECAKKVAGGPDEAPAPRHGGRNCSPRPGQHHYGDSAAALEQERERRNINQSLLTLGRVIAALREKTGRIPYRDSKLTRLLKDALGGSCKTVLIATISPALSAVEETISTLTYAEQAVGIRNRPVASSALRVGRGCGSGELRGEVGCAGPGSSSVEWAEMEMKMNYLAQEVEEAQAALAKKYEEEQELRQRAECAESELRRARADLQHLSEAFEKQQAHCAHMSASAKAVGREVAGSVDFLAGAREALAREVAELKEDRAAEERFLALLRRQRGEIQADVSAARLSLEAVQGDLATTCAEVSRTREAQEHSQGRALEAIISFATNEFKNLGTELRESSLAVSSRLEGLQTEASKVAASVASAEQRGADARVEAERAVSALADSFAARVSTAEQQSKEASQAAERTLSGAAHKLRGIEVADISLDVGCEDAADTDDRPAATAASVDTQPAAVAPAAARADRTANADKENAVSGEVQPRARHAEKKFAAGGAGNVVYASSRGVLKERNLVR